MESKEREIINMYDNWIRVKQRKLSLGTYLEKNGIKYVAIYGMNQLGYTLMDELLQDGISVVYGIDKLLAGKAGGLPVKSLEDEWEKVDAIIVSAFQYYEEIYPVIHKKVPDIKVLSLDVVICKVLKEA